MPLIDGTYHFQSPIGHVGLTLSDAQIVELKFIEEESGSPLPDSSFIFEQLSHYFSGKRFQLELPFRLEGTSFQKRVWKEVLRIPRGHTASYADIAKKLGDINSVRAVGTANGQNPCLLLVPCHRIIGSDGQLTGYAGGLHRKKWLLEHESGLRQGQLFD